MSKAQVFYEKACVFSDWETERQKVGENRIVTTTRGDEAFRFVWAPNKTTGRVTFHSGTHRIGEEVEPYSNVTEALRIMASAPGAVKAVKRKEGQKAFSVQRVPFNAEEDSDDAIIISLAGKKIEWENRRYGEGLSESAVVSRYPSKHTRITEEKDGDGLARILHFVDATGDTGFRSVRLNSITHAEDFSGKEYRDKFYADSNTSSRSSRGNSRRVARN